MFANILNIRVSVYHYEYGIFYFYIGEFAGIVLYSTIAITIKESKLLEFIGKNTLLCLITTIITLMIYYICIKIFTLIKANRQIELLTKY